MHFYAEEVFDGVFQNTFSGVFPLFPPLSLFCSVQVLYSLASGSDSSFCVYPLCVCREQRNAPVLPENTQLYTLSVSISNRQTDTIKYRHTQQAQAQSFQNLHTIMLVPLCVIVSVTSFYFI